MLDKRIIYTKCMYNCLYHVSSVGKAVSLLDALCLVVIWLPTDSTWYKQLYNTQVLFLDQLENFIHLCGGLLIYFLPKYFFFLFTV